MYPKQKVVAMLLAGGQGSRLGVLTNKVAKPAIPYGGQYRIIDFPLSNCVNSGINAIGILTQYQPLLLNDYIGNGEIWKLNYPNGHIQILPPFQRESDADWYKGTADAIFQNIDYIQKYDPEYVIILSGDHIYKMDYSKMIEFHEKKKADCTIAAINVPIEQAKRFGIINSDKDGKIYEFQEKPEFPKSNKASMGIYVFSWDKLKKYLKEDELDPKSSKDFGKNVLPMMLAKNEKLYSYDFYGYWKDIGTIDSLWESNMDLLDSKIDLNLNDDNWKIYSRLYNFSPYYITDEAKVNNSVISNGCHVYGEIKNSILFPGVYVAEGAKIDHSVIMPETIVKEDAIINYSVISQKVKIGKGAKIGEESFLNDKNNPQITVIGDDVTIGDKVKIKAGLMIENDIILRQEKKEIEKT